jgi:hypothetical protein
MLAVHARTALMQSPVDANQGTPRDRESSGRLGFLEGIRIDHGPIDILGRFFLLADSMARTSGMTLAFASMQELVAVNRANAQSWRPLLPHYDPSYGGIDGENAFCVLGLNGEGEVVATQAARLYTLTNGSFFDEATSLRLFYPDPVAQALGGESCVISAPAARTIGGRVAFSGAAWYRPDYRGRDLAPVLSRISRAYSHAIWNTDHTVTFVAKTLVEKGFVQRCGYANIEWGVELRGFAIGPYHGALVWIDSGQMVQDLSAYMATQLPEVEIGICERRA